MVEADRGRHLVQDNAALRAALLCLDGHGLLLTRWEFGGACIKAAGAVASGEDRQINLDLVKSVLGLKVGDEIALSEAGFVRLSKAYFEAIGRAFV